MIIRRFNLRTREAKVLPGRRSYKPWLRKTGGECGSVKKLAKSGNDKRERDCAPRAGTFEGARAPCIHPPFTLASRGNGSLKLSDSLTLSPRVLRHLTASEFSEVPSSPVNLRHCLSSGGILSDWRKYPRLLLTVVFVDTAANDIQRAGRSLEESGLVGKKAQLKK